MSISKKNMDGKTKITISKNDGYMEIRVEGHNSNPLICSAISAIMQTTELGLKSLALGEERVIIKEYKECFQD